MNTNNMTINTIAAAGSATSTAVSITDAGIGAKPPSSGTEVKTSLKLSSGSEDSGSEGITDDAGSEGTIDDAGCEGTVEDSGCEGTVEDSGCEGTVEDSGCEGTVEDSG